jgi:DNA replication and repair protein RecF
LTARVAFEHVVIRAFRNIGALEFAPSPRVNVISGPNGQGKTSLLEALYYVATSKSFRTEQVKDMLQIGAESGSVRATISENRLRREQRAVIMATERAVFVDGKKPDTLSEYATRTPVVVFHPGDLGIFSGPSSARRTVLDRIALFLDPKSADDRRRYVHASRSRRAVLEQRGTSAQDLPALERIMAVHGAALSQARANASERLCEALLPLFGQMAASGLRLDARFVPGGHLDAAELELELERRREHDLRRRTATFGPNRDDFDVKIDGRSVRKHASQGQQRILTLALKAAELQCVRQARGAEPILLLDDVSSELDPERTGAVYEFLRNTPGQVFVTATRPELFLLPSAEASERADWALFGGAIRGVE